MNIGGLYKQYDSRSTPDKLHVCQRDNGWTETQVSTYQSSRPTILPRVAITVGGKDDTHLRDAVHLAYYQIVLVF